MLVPWMKTIDRVISQYLCSRFYFQPPSILLPPVTAMTFSNAFHSLSLAFIIIGACSFAQAFQVQQQRPPTNPNQSSTSLHGTCNGRRNFLSRGAGAAMSVLVGGTILEQPAEASYTGFTQREEDWKKREEKGEIKISNARDLRSQLREIAPMNSEGSKLFCPNGSSAAVTPMMENRCGDRQALPSVYGRMDDAMGNSIPGFGGGSGGSANASTLRAELETRSYFGSSR